MPCLRKRKVKCRTAVNRTLSPDAAAVPVNDPLDGRQSHPSSGEIILIVKALEGAKKSIGVSWVESGTVVSNVVSEPPVMTRFAKLDTSGFTLGGKFPGVAKQVLKRNS